MAVLVALLVALPALAVPLVAFAPVALVIPIAFVEAGEATDGLEAIGVEVGGV